MAGGAHIALSTSRRRPASCLRGVRAGRVFCACRSIPNAGRRAGVSTDDAHCVNGRERRGESRHNYCRIVRPGTSFPTLANFLPFPRRGHFAGRSGQAKFTLRSALPIPLKIAHDGPHQGSNLSKAVVCVAFLHGGDHEGDQFHACGQAIRGLVHVVH